MGRGKRERERERESVMMIYVEDKMSSVGTEMWD